MNVLALVTGKVLPKRIAMIMHKKNQTAPRREAFRCSGQQLEAIMRFAMERKLEQQTLQFVVAEPCLRAPRHRHRYSMGPPMPNLPLPHPPRAPKRRLSPSFEPREKRALSDHDKRRANYRKDAQQALDNYFM